ncbi:hypothetical protein AVL56_17350 [Alteromonas stellipolaris]|uniref:hypothetical protein n=1 Tax=Alteromonas stellipolaris TaxID=233316 RepID=UPI00076FE31A|nr:hypothetical protein [Alteromonas stellipolaris]AMJ95901.1 hypothetical protein AVL56_17350 [Alteromonas stellipolaris]
MNNFPLFFIHIPKTAGSSFRVAAEQYFGSDATYFDYGQGSKETHPDILKYEYELKDRYLAAKCIKNNAKFLSGHVIYPKYAPFFQPKSVVTFVREPAQQIRSHFEHFSRLHGYKGNFKDFIKENRFANMQSKALNGVWNDAIGFIGITERYSESITLFNQYYSTDIKVLDINKNTAKPSGAYMFSEDEISLIRKMNPQDFALYDYALKRFDLHKGLLSKGLPLVRFGEMNLALKDKGKQLNMWGCCYEQEEALEADILLDDEVVDELKLSDYRAQGAERNIHRSGFVGKVYKYPATFEKGQVVKVREKQTQLIMFKDVVS